MSDEQLIELLGRCTFRHASSPEYKDIPHAYIVQGKGNGCRCVICGLMLAEKYGDDAQGLIHVHHLRQLASIGTKYTIDPIEDLRPVCPTCHAVIHYRTPAFTIEEVRKMIANNQKTEGV